MYLLDSHCDTPSQILRLRDLSIDNDHSHVDFPKLFRGGVDGAFFALYVPASMQESDAYTYSYRLLDAVRSAVVKNPDKASFAVSHAQALSNKDAGLFSVFLGLENGSPIGTNMERLREYYDAGVRYVTLCHTGNNEICDSCAQTDPRWNGLSPFGREVVAEMNRLGIMVDISHAADQTVRDVLEVSEAPIIASHSSARALCSHRRNLPDDLLRAIAMRDGVIQVTIYNEFVKDEPGATIQDYIAHINHVVEVAGMFQI